MINQKKTKKLRKVARLTVTTEPSNKYDYVQVDKIIYVTVGVGIAPQPITVRRTRRFNSKDTVRGLYRQLKKFDRVARNG